MITLYIIVGLPFSGKSTLALKVAKYTNSELVSYDSVWSEEKNNLEPNMDKVEEWKYISNATHIKIDQYLKNDKSVVYDNMNLQKEHRDRLRAVAQSYFAHVIVIYMNVSIAKIKDRQKENENSQLRHTVSDENFNNALSQLQIPTINENVKVFLPSDNVENWIKDNIKQNRPSSPL